MSSPRRDGLRGLVQGFGGLRVGDITMKPLFGGSVAVNLTPNIQAVGEFGRLNNVMPVMLADALSFVPGDFRLSALYGQGGIRLLSSPRSAASVYVEGAYGLARLRPGLASSVGEYTGLANLALRFLDRTEPIANIGGGVVIHGGPVAVDLGYRYSKVFTNDIISETLSLGSGMTFNQVRMGIGVRF